jgi:hypothetical protein
MSARKKASRAHYSATFTELTTQPERKYINSNTSGEHGKERNKKKTIFRRNIASLPSHLQSEGEKKNKFSFESRKLHLEGEIK